MKNLKRVHCIGIGGIHVSAVAKLLLGRGVAVSGSDLVKSEITKELQKIRARVFIGHSDTNLSLDMARDRRMHTNDTNEGGVGQPRLQDEGRIDLVVYSDAVPEDNVERVEAKGLGIRQMSSYEFMGELSREYYTIAVSGTNGKSTTTAMLGLILEAGGLDPTVIVGTKVKEWGGNIRLGKSKYLVTEADEYRAHMLNLEPKMIVLTNIEEDHLDYYRDLKHIVETFKEYVKKLPKDGVLVYNEDDQNIVSLFHCCIVRNVGFSARDVDSLKLQVPGEFNRYNAAAAARAARELGVNEETIKKSLENFKGTWRRFERVGERDGALIISDYAHHPTAVAGTIRAAREMYPHRRLIVVFQPHQHNRTRRLFDDFVKVLSEAPADVLILSEIYDVAGRTSGEDKKVSSRDLVREIKKLRNKEIRVTDYDGLKQIATPTCQSYRPPAPRKLRGALRAGKAMRAGSRHLTSNNVRYAKDLEETYSMIVGTVKPKDVALIMGAGDIDGVARGLVK